MGKAEAASAGDLDHYFATARRFDQDAALEAYATAKRAWRIAGGASVLTCLSPGAIAVSGQSLGTERASSIEQHIGELAYFSFITLTTVGYGDIAPVSPVARSMAILEALAGQLYLAAFVARLVGAMSKPDVRK